jgi:hypothetical protein
MYSLQYKVGDVEKIYNARPMDSTDFQLSDPP